MKNKRNKPYKRVIKRKICRGCKDPLITAHDQNTKFCLMCRTKDRKKWAKEKLVSNVQQILHNIYEFQHNRKEL